MARKQPKKLALSNRELATVLAALRLWQKGIVEDAALPTAFDHFNWTEGNGPKVQPLDADDIDRLCERLNRRGGYE